MSDQADELRKYADTDAEGFRAGLGPFVVAAETTRMPMIFSDATAPGRAIIFVNQAFLDLTGYEEHEVLGQKFDFLFQRGTDPEALTEIQTAFQGARDLETPIRFQRKDGGTVWVAVHISPVRDSTGSIVQHFASFSDVTRQKREAERLRFLLDELNHRTQNTLATVLAIAGQTLRGAVDEQTFDAFEGRILALGETHGLLGSVDWDGIGLQEVIEQTLETVGVLSRVSIHGDKVLLQPKDALSLTLAFHELATNAISHGALSTVTTGKVDVTWRIEAVPDRETSQGAGPARGVGISGAGKQVRLQWRESGGPAVTSPSFKGFGRRLIENGLAEDLNGEVRLNFKASGVSCEIVMPVSKGIGE